MLERLAAFHRDPDESFPEPEVLALILSSDGRPCARVLAHGRAFRLEYSHGTWSFA